MARITDLINTSTCGIAFKRAAEVEARLLEGCNRFAIEDELGGIKVGRTVYEVPRWRDRPLVRLEIARLRCIHRHQGRG